MLEVANSLQLMTADRTMPEVDTPPIERPSPRPWPRNDPKRRIILINPAGTAQGRLDEQLGGLGFSLTYLPSQMAALSDLELYAPTCESVVLDWRAPSPKDPLFAISLAKKAADLGLPVLTLTSAERTDDTRTASEAGLETILAMPCRLGDLKDRLDDVSRRSRKLAGPVFTDAVAFLESCKFRFRTPDDVVKLAPVIAQLFPEPERRAAGIAELMMNAIEHGNLEIGQERKADWLARGVYDTEVVTRLMTPPYTDRWAELIVNRRDDGLMIVIMDQGCGFCWQDIINCDALRNLELDRPCGNGIAKAKRDSFDDIRFNHTGNQVTAFVETGSPSA
jgi:DNA-binding response OmpR family regulator